MPATFPAAFDVPPNPTLNTSMAASGFEHDLAHVNLNDMMKAVQLRVGLTNSPDTTSVTNQLNTAMGNITTLQGNVSTLNSQLGITNANLTSVTNTVSGHTTSINNLIATKLNLAGGTMTGQLAVSYNAPAISANAYVTSHVLISNTASTDNAPQLGFQASGALGMTLYLNASGLSAITNLGGSSLIINNQGQLNAGSFANGSIPAAKIVPATITTAQLSNNAVTNPIIAPGSIDATKFDSTVMGSIQTAVGCPIGTILPYVSAWTTPSGWLPCDGRAISRTTYANLYNIMGTNYGAGDGSSTFNLPDLRSRFPLGSFYNGTAWTGPPGLTVRQWGQTGGEENHALTWGETGAHYHNTGHTHTMGNHTHYGVNHLHDLQNHQHYCSGVDHLHGLGGHTHGYTTVSFSTGYQLAPQGGGALVGSAGANTGGPSTGSNASDRSLAFWSNAPNVNNTGACDRDLTTSGPSTNTSDGASVSTTDTQGSGSAHNNMPPFQVVTYIIKY